MSFEEEIAEKASVASREWARHSTSATAAMVLIDAGEFNVDHLPMLLSNAFMAGAIYEQSGMLILDPADLDYRGPKEA